MSKNPALHFYDFHPALADFKTEVLQGLSQTQKRLASKFFYDLKGSQLFEQITELEEYYPTRTEISILQEHGDAMIELLGRDCLLLELGSGSSKKIRVLLDTLKPAAYMPLDISKQHLLESAHCLASDYPDIDIHAACVDYSTDFSLPYCPQHLPRAAFFPGSSIGNFEPHEAVKLLKRVHTLLDSGGTLLIGVDLKKHPAILHAAYNDAQHVTAAFNLNILQRINHELDGNFVLDNFSHYAFYNPHKGRIEGHLFSHCEQTVQVAGETFEFAQSESIHTENSHKFNIGEFQALAAQAGFESKQVWTDAAQLFSVHCLQAV